MGMTVAELIKHLEAFDQGLPVWGCSEGGYVQSAIKPADVYVTDMKSAYNRPLPLRVVLEHE